MYTVQKEGSLMEQNKAAYQAYSATFPSDKFLEKHFGEDVPIVGNPHRVEITRGHYAILRDLFDLALRILPKYILKSQLQVGTGIVTVYVFRKGKPEEWVDPYLDKHGLPKDLSPEAFSELCQEFISLCEAGALYQSDWWKWKTEGQSIWIEAISEALVDGKPKRRTLKDLLNPENQD